jgi:hypothetical protein
MLDAMCKHHARLGALLGTRDHCDTRNSTKGR